MEVITLQVKEASKPITMIDEAKGGNLTAVHAVLNRVWPARKGAKLEFELPEIGRADELPHIVWDFRRPFSSAITQAAT